MSTYMPSSVYDPIDQPVSRPHTPPDLLHDSDEDDEDSFLSSPSGLSSPVKEQMYFHKEDVYRQRRKSTPYRSPPLMEYAIHDHSVVFQLSDSGIYCTSKVISGQLPTRPSQPKPKSRFRRTRTINMIQIPSQKKRSYDMSDIESTPEQNTDKPSDHPEDMPHKRPRKNARRSSASSGRPSRVKGPCQACNEASDGCMRKAFNWPFPSQQVFTDKGKPFVYLCNKCGLRYNKSSGCVCRHCRWVFCKEEKRKALQYIEAMRRNRPDGHIDPNEDIENFFCSPKYWTCSRPWKVGWVLNNLDEDDETEYPNMSSVSSQS